MFPFALFFSCSSENVPTAVSDKQAVETSSEVHKLDPVVSHLQKEALKSQEGMSLLVELCDDIGNRIAGSPSYDEAALWGVQTMKNIGLTDVSQQPVRVKYWKRGSESLRLIEPREETLGVLGLGMSIGTPPQGIEAEAVVVSSFEELDATDVQNKIVVYNAPFVSYGKTVKYRTHS